eukprot:scaffold4743_cov171-Amphora_coffeaeformis.AAC.11
MCGDSDWIVKLPQEARRYRLGRDREREEIVDAIVEAGVIGVMGVRGVRRLETGPPKEARRPK